MIISQVMIAVFGVTAIWLSQRPDPDFRRWAPVFGLAGQPFWFYATYTTGQWGMLALVFAYTYAWASGINNLWRRP